MESVASGLHHRFHGEAREGNIGRVAVGLDLGLGNIVSGKICGRGKIVRGCNVDAFHIHHRLQKSAVSNDGGVHGQIAVAHIGLARHAHASRHRK